MSDETGYSGFSELNALGNPRIVIESAYGGKAGTGPIGNTEPTGIVATGLSIETGKLFVDTSVRKGMSTEKNVDAKRMSSRK